MGTRLLLRRILLRAPKPISLISCNPMPNPISSPDSFYFPVSNSTSYHIQVIGFSSHSNGLTPLDYSSMLQEDEYQRLANSTIHLFLEKLEEYGDSVEIDGFDVDYGNEVLTLKLGSLGTYVINKQTVNRQIWMSSPVSGPSRFDWDQNVQAWIYKRTKQESLKVLETELEQLCKQPISLS